MKRDGKYCLAHFFIWDQRLDFKWDQTLDFKWNQTLDFKCQKTERLLLEHHSLQVCIANSNVMTTVGIATLILCSNSH